MGRKTKMNSITSPELLAQVNPKNMELIDDFMDYLRSVDRSETTIHTYRNDLEIAWVWSLQHNDNKFYVDWTKRNVVAFQNWLINENGNSPARVRRLRATLSSLGNFVEAILDDEFPNYRNIINKIEAPVNNPVREKTVLSEEEIEDILDKLVQKKKYKKACFIALAVFSGRRKSELCRFKVSDFGDDHLVCDGALYKSDPMKTKGRGSAGKTLCCYTLAKKFKPYLDLWLDDRNKNNIDSEWLFPDSAASEEQMSISTVNSWMRSISKLTNKEIYAHAFRHAFTTYLVRSGIPESVITQIVGWESIDMCRVYTDIEADEQISMYFKDGEISAPDQKSLSDI